MHKHIHTYVLTHITDVKACMACESIACISECIGEIHNKTETAYIECCEATNYTNTHTDIHVVSHTLRM